MVRREEGTCRFQGTCLAGRKLGGRACRRASGWSIAQGGMMKEDGQDFWVLRRPGEMESLDLSLTLDTT